MFIRRVLFFLYLVFLMALSICKSAEIFLPYIYQFEHFLGGDKWMHFKLAMLLGVLSVLAFTSTRLILVLLMLISGLVLDEALQYVLVSRRFEWLDGIYGVAGLLFGAAISAALLKLAHGRFIIVKNDD